MHTENNMSKYNKPRIFIDIDGVLANLDKKLTELFPDHPEMYYGNKLWAQMGTYPRFFRTLEPFDGAFEFVDKIIELYWSTHYISILTALPFPTGELVTASYDKNWWIDYFITFNIDVHTIIGGENKCQYVNKPGDILIDDMMKNLIPWAQHGGYGIHHVSFDQSLKDLKHLVDMQK